MNFVRGDFLWVSCWRWEVRRDLVIMYIGWRRGVEEERRMSMNVKLLMNIKGWKFIMRKDLKREIIRI